VQIPNSKQGGGGERITMGRVVRMHNGGGKKEKGGLAVKKEK